jgi:hypothetical protein
VGFDTRHDGLFSLAMGRAGLEAENSRMGPRRADFRGPFSLKIGGEGRGANGQLYLVSACITTRQAGV